MLLHGLVSNHILHQYNIVPFAIGDRGTVVELGTYMRVIVGSNPAQTDVALVVVRSYHRLSSSLQTKLNKWILNK